MTGDIALGMKYKKAILDQIKEQVDPSENDLLVMSNRLGKASSDELERTYEAFERFGVKTVMDQVRI